VIVPGQRESKRPDGFACCFSRRSSASSGTPAASRSQAWNNGQGRSHLDSLRRRGVSVWNISSNLKCRRASRMKGHSNLQCSHLETTHKIYVLVDEIVLCLLTETNQSFWSGYWWNRQRQSTASIGFGGLHCIRPHTRSSPIVLKCYSSTPVTSIYRSDSIREITCLRIPVYVGPTC